MATVDPGSVTLNGYGALEALGHGVKNAIPGSILGTGSFSSQGRKSEGASAYLLGECIFGATDVTSYQECYNVFLPEPRRVIILGRGTCHNIGCQP